MAVFRELNEYNDRVLGISREDSPSIKRADSGKKNPKRRKKARSKSVSMTTYNNTINILKFIAITAAIGVVGYLTYLGIMAYLG